MRISPHLRLAFRVVRIDSRVPAYPDSIEFLTIRLALLGYFGRGRGGSSCSGGTMHGRSRTLSLIRHVVVVGRNDEEVEEARQMRNNRRSVRIFTRLRRRVHSDSLCLRAKASFEAGCSLLYVALLPCIVGARAGRKTRN